MCVSVCECERVRESVCVSERESECERVREVCVRESVRGRERSRSLYAASQFVH